MKNFLLPFSTLLLLCFCYIACNKIVSNKTNKTYSMDNTNTYPSNNKITDTVYFAGGCFWGTEHLFKQINGVITTEAGYANGNKENPTYEEVCSGKTGFTETVQVVFNPAEVRLEKLIELYFLTIDPTSINKQGNDVGSQYRTGIYFTNQQDQVIIENSIKEQTKNYNKPIVVEIKALSNFYKAEEYHQDYLDKNPNGYCHIDPKFFEIAREANAPKSQKK